MKIIELANGRGDARPTDPKSVLEQRLADLEAAVRRRQKDWRAARAAAASEPQDNRVEIVTRERAARIALERELAGRQAQYEREIARADAVRAMVDEQLREASLEVERARHAEASAAAVVDRLTRAEADAATRLAEREGAFATELSTITAARDRLEHQLSDVESALASARQRHALAATEVERLTRREADLTAQCAGEAATRAALERRVADVEAALSAVSEQISRERAAAAEQQATYQAHIQREIAKRRSVEDSLASAQTAHADAEERHESAVAAAAAVLAERESELASMRAEASAIRSALERRAAEAEAARSDAEQHHRSAMVAAVARLAEREAQFEAELSSITATRDSLERQLREVDARLAQETDARTTLERAITDARSAATDTERRFRDEIATITENARADRARLEQQLSIERQDFQTELADERQQHQSAMVAAAARLAEREAQFEAELAAITATRDSLHEQLGAVEARLTQQTRDREALEQAISELRSAAAAAEQRFHDEIAAVTVEAEAERRRLESQISHDHHVHETQLADEQQQHRSAMAMAATRLAEREAQFEAELSSITATRDSLERQLRDVEAKFAAATEARAALERAIGDVRSALANAERRFRDEIATVTENARVERTRLEDQITRERAVAAGKLAARGAEFEAERARLSGDHAGALARLQASIAERDLRIEEQTRAAASLQNRLDASEAENRRQFEQTPVPLIRCTRDGVLTSANQAFAAFVGCRRPGELRDKDFSATLFESRDDLAWLIERSANARTAQSVETTCTRKDGARIAVRLSARPSVSGFVEIAAEDLTNIRVLEDRLRESHRMEAVGRVASEIAVTCGKLLRDVYRDAQRLLAASTGSSGQGDAETLLDDVARAGSFLHQLVAYGHEQTASLAPVDLNRVLRDLEPVLKQVAGDAIALEVGKTASPVTVDVTAERVERLLVNAASYGRQRMPDGGRLRIELSTVVVDGKFISQYPNVRQGPHALITVTEVARAAADGPVPDHAGAPESGFASGRPAVDLGALQELISECGGHLWITAEPGGSMVVKMRLPLRAAWQGQADTHARQGLGRMTARLFGR